MRGQAKLMSRSSAFDAGTLDRRKGSLPIIISPRLNAAKCVRYVQTMRAFTFVANFLNFTL
jgi:hypothetical protein